MKNSRPDTGPVEARGRKLTPFHSTAVTGAARASSRENAGRRAAYAYLAGQKDTATDTTSTSMAAASF